MTDADRIKLAEAMGWKPHPKMDGTSNCVWQAPGKAPIGWHGVKYLPDPFTDANGDYAVLEWTRKQDTVFQVKFAAELRDHPADYMIGNNARAALKVIEQGERSEVSGTLFDL